MASMGLSTQARRRLDSDRRRRVQNLGPGGLSYLQDLINQYLTISDNGQPRNTKADALARGITDRQTQEEPFTWDDVHAMELTLVELLAEDDLRTWA